MRKALAEAWRRFPDLPIESPLEARIARTRERVAALRPLHDAITAETEAERQRANFAFAGRRVASADADPRYSDILRGRDDHGYDWNTAHAFADGRHAARAGWEPRFSAPEHGKDIAARRAAYDHGFSDGGGVPDDIFDTARRSYHAASREAAGAEPPGPCSQSRPRPSLWPSPSDAPRPVSWHRRLLILGEQEATQGALGHLESMRAVAGSETATIVLADHREGLRLLCPGSRAPSAAGGYLTLLTSADFGDILIAADEAELVLVDSLANQIPIARTMERTRNSSIQQRAQFRIWLARGRLPGAHAAAGHIRWGKVAAGLYGRLGEFTARYAGPVTPRGHRIIVEDASGGPARGYRSPDGRILQAETTISNRAHLRIAMTAQLRSFAASLRF